MALGLLIMKLVFEIFADWPPKRQTVSSTVFRCSQLRLWHTAYGNNDAQKTMGIITLALVTAGLHDPSNGIPLWVKLLCATTMALGTSIGGGRIMRTVAMALPSSRQLLALSPKQVLPLSIEIMTALGAPVSTTQVITTSIMGAGSARRRSSVRWGCARKILLLGL